ncbi:hypothetical protein MKW98_020357 [Papaver atlanticum]|uniref:FHA domain-containing protein n=1 Tax=Papaver atlanticum TaxID=357466 RepID=A0AAD4RVG5_9MAGN|nr:hypothetical protein MKW98_020357 [Papaver atlanticum]
MGSSKPEMTSSKGEKESSPAAQVAHSQGLAVSASPVAGKATVATPLSVTTPAKSSSNKEQGLMKNLKGFDGLVVALGSGEMSQSRDYKINGSSDGSDGNTARKQQPRRKRSCEDMTSTGAKVSKHEGLPSDLWVKSERELKSERRKQSNRESAGRSRLSKQAETKAETEELATKVSCLHRDAGDISVTKMKAAEEALEKQKPSFELSGKLAEETNRVKGVTLLFTEPSDARRPDVRWRLYVFKNGEVLNEPLYIHRKTCYLFGRERRVADIPTDHPSCSKQHAVIQYRLVEKELPDDMLKKKISPYIMDLGSTNGTFINDNRIEAQHYYELKEKDTIKFGNSSREYVVLHENSAH